MEFTVLQSVYKKDTPDFLDASLKSIADQTLLPQKIILVKDGTLTEELETVIEKWQKKLPLYVCGYDQNQGLAFALNYGLQFVETELVARMDSDDICATNRFQKQISFMAQNPSIALCSSYISEFIENPEQSVSIRRVPLKHEEIQKYLKKRNAFNHMAVCFRKSAVLESGSYQVVPYFEDYDLWIRMIQHGFKAVNLPDILVNARIGNDMIGRRHGFAYSKHEINFLRRQLKSGFISRFDFLKFFVMRVPVRLLPKKCLELIYKVLRK